MSASPARWARSVIVAMLAVAGCAPRPFVPEVPAPSHERVMALARQRPVVPEAELAPLEFVHPKARLALGGLGGVEIMVQIRVRRHADNRAVDLAVLAADGSRLYGSSKTLEGLLGESLMPLDARHARVRLPVGSYLLLARVFGPGGTLRHQASMEFTVCGGAECAGDGGL